MLQHIQIRDLVIVRELALELAPGMTALTGETGAGKSILIDALGLALGEKGDKELIRNGADKAEVSAVFDIHGHAKVQQWLEQNELRSGDDCILRRVLVRNGRGRSFINGSPVPVQLLAEIGELLVDIHGQHAHQSLLKSSLQRQLLDAYAGHRELLERVNANYRAYREASRRLEQLRTEAGDRSNRIDYLRFQVDELDQLAATGEELPELETEQRRLAHAEQLQTDCGRLSELLFDSDQSVQDALAHGCQLIAELATLDPELDSCVELLEGARIQVEESAGLLRSYAHDIELDPERLAAVDERLGQLHDMARKHRIAIEELPGRHRELREELDALENSDNVLADLEEEVRKRLDAYNQAAGQLSASRSKAAIRLSEIVTASMQGLALKGGHFEAQVTALEERIGADGMDRVDFLVATNPGQAVALLAKVASGGELSRISLAIQVATIDCGEVPTLIFDEVDVGIGGAVAEMVGQLLRRLGEQRQVLCVTHLPQVAVQGHHHLMVKKESDGIATETDIQPLSGEQRMAEIARMLGGLQITEQTLAHASEMMARANG